MARRSRQPLTVSPHAKKMSDWIAVRTRPSQGLPAPAIILPDKSRLTEALVAPETWRRHRGKPAIELAPPPKSSEFRGGSRAAWRVLCLLPDVLARTTPSPCRLATLREWTATETSKLDRVGEGRGEPLNASSFAADLDRLLAALDGADALGWLVASHGRIQKRIAFERGAAVFAVSNDPKDLMGQALLRAGLLSEHDLADALAMPPEPHTTTPHLYNALLAMQKVTPEQTRVVFEQKLREAVLDLFVWTSGTVQVQPGPLPSGAVFPTRIPLAGVRTEGAKRRARWATVRKVFPSFDVAFERTGEWPSGFPSTPGDRRLAQKLDEGQTLAQIFLELHGQDYAVGIRVTNLFQKGQLAQRPAAGFVPEPEPERMTVPSSRLSPIPTGEFTRATPSSDYSDGSDSPPPTFSSELTAALLERAQTLLDEHKFQEALAILGELVQNDPLAASDAWGLMVAAEEGVIAAAEAAGLTANATLTLTRPIAMFAGVVFPPDQAFVLSRFAAGKMTVGELRALCPFPPTELFQILQKFLDEKIIKRV